MHAAMVAHHAFYFEFFLHDCFCWRFNFFVFFSFMYSFPFQQQAVAHDTAECHGRTGYHRVQQEAVDGIEYSGRNGYAYYIIYKCPEEILPDGPDGETRQTESFRYLSQVGRDDGHLGYIHGDVAASTHGDA